VSFLFLFLIPEKDSILDFTRKGGRRRKGGGKRYTKADVKIQEDAQNLAILNVLFIFKF